MGKEEGEEEEKKKKNRFWHSQKRVGERSVHSRLGISPLLLRLLETLGRESEEAGGKTASSEHT